jgi:two-component system response regulator YesN
LLKIVIVDDEALERKALRKIIQDHLKNIQIIGEAANGRIAIELAEQLKPDIMLMDIKMPGINGVEAVKQIKGRYPEMHFIMVSAFDTFEYAKEVMRQGVKEYILKPSTKNDVIAAIEREHAEIFIEKEAQVELLKLKGQFDKALTFAKTKWIASLLYDQIQDIRFEDWSELLGFQVQAGFAAVFYFHEKQYTSDEAKEMNFKRLKSIVQEKTNREIILGTMTNGQVPVLFFTKGNKEKNDIQRLVRTIVTAFQNREESVLLYAGIGESYQSVQYLSKSFHEAAIALNTLLAAKKQQYGFASEVKYQEMNLDSFHAEKEIMDFLRQGDISQTLQHFSLYLNNDGSLDENIKRVEELFVIAIRMLKDLGIHYTRSCTFYDCQTIERLFEVSTRELTQLVQYVHTWRNSHSKNVLVKAKEYIDSHYQASLTLEEVSEYIELSPYYFSKLFKERLGITFIDYLTEVRIEHAKKAMLNSDKSLKEICYLVGYKDPNYFSRVFKKHTGISATDYRKQGTTS